jgi:hypothetical protein
LLNFQISASDFSAPAAEPAPWTVSAEGFPPHSSPGWP